MEHFLWIAGGTAAALLALAGVLHLLPHLGAAGRRAAEHMGRAPTLDLLITYFTIAPLVVGPIVAGGVGFLGGLVGQLAALFIWQAIHTLAHPEARKGPRIIKVLNRTVGPWRNYTAVWLTALVVPLFWVVRLAQIFVYTPITWLVRLPKYDAADWVCVSRQKFEGLVGHDLIWCLYCDWMTGVWSLGSEMLRNVESFWCPIRFASEKKCANCCIDFPDIEGGWVRADGTMAEVAATLQRMYHPEQDERPWFGHPARLTIEGEEPPPVRREEPVAAGR